MVSTANIYPLFTHLLKESDEVAIPATAYFVKHCDNKGAKLNKIKGHLFIQKTYNNSEFIKVYFFHNNSGRNGGMPDNSGEILSRYHYQHSWWMFSLNFPEEEGINCDGGWAYVYLLTGDSTITIKNQYVEEEDSLIED